MYIRCLHKNSSFVVVIFCNGKHHIQKRCFDCNNRFGRFYSKDKFVKKLLEVVDLREKVRESCDKCGSLEGTEVHHITYVPEKISNLCISCHKVITRMNTAYSAGQNSSLTVEQRLIVWDLFCQIPLREDFKKEKKVKEIKDNFTQKVYVRVLK